MDNVKDVYLYFTAGDVALGCDACGESIQGDYEGDAADLLTFAEVHRKPFAAAYQFGYDVDGDGPGAPLTWHWIRDAG